MEVDMDSMPPLTPGSVITVSAKEEQILMDDSTSVAGEMPSYRSPLLMAISLSMVKPHRRSRPPQCVSEALHMSPPHHLRRRRKKEDFDVRIGKEVMNQTPKQNQAVFIVKMYCY